VQAVITRARTVQLITRRKLLWFMPDLPWRQFRMGAYCGRPRSHFSIRSR